MTKETSVDINVIMPLEKWLRELVAKKGLRKVAHDLGIDPASLYRSLKDGSNLKLGRIEKLLDYFGYDLKIFRKGGGEGKHPMPSTLKRNRRGR